MSKAAVNIYQIRNLILGVHSSSTHSPHYLGIGNFSQQSEIM